MGDKNKLAHSPQPGYVLDRILDAAVKIRMEPDTPERDKALSSRPGEFHPEALTEPCVSLSTHTALASHSPATSRW